MQKTYIFFVLGMAGDTLALLDGVIDSSHRSFLAVVQRVKLNVLRPRPPAEFIPVDPRWVPGDMSSDYVFKNTFVSYTFRT